MAAFVTGGCGFIGYHIVKALVASKEYTSVHVVSRNPTKSDVSSKETIKKIFESIGAIKVVFHVASPKSVGNTGSLQPFLQSNVVGTQNLLDCAREYGVEAFVFSSSTTVYAADKDGHLINISEDAPMVTLDGPTDFYSKTKAEAERCVLAANGKLKTVAIRITCCYGERDEQMTGNVYANKAKWRDQIGDNKNIWDHVSAENCCATHLLAAKALLQNKPGVAGEAFNVTDGEPMPFWNFVRLIYKAGGEDIHEQDIRVIPSTLMLTLATVAEWVYWIFTFGYCAPKVLRRFRFEYMIVSRTFLIEKAKERLGYEPADNRMANIEAAVRYLKQQEASENKKES